MSLFAPAIVVRLTADELARLTLPIVGDGGAQGFLRELNARLQGGALEGVLELEDTELQRVQRYAEHNDGDGGHQGRFRAVLSAAFRAGWVQP